MSLNRFPRGGRGMPNTPKNSHFGGVRPPQKIAKSRKNRFFSKKKFFFPIFLKNLEKVFLSFKNHFWRRLSTYLGPFWCHLHWKSDQKPLITREIERFRFFWLGKKIFFFDPPNFFLPPKKHFLGPIKTIFGRKGHSGGYNCLKMFALRLPALFSIWASRQQTTKDAMRH